MLHHICTLSCHKLLAGQNGMLVLCNQCLCCAFLLLCPVILGAASPQRLLTNTSAGWPAPKPPAHVAHLVCQVEESPGHEPLVRSSLEQHLQVVRRCSSWALGRAECLLPTCAQTAGGRNPGGTAAQAGGLTPAASRRGTPSAGLGESPSGRWPRGTQCSAGSPGSSSPSASTLAP